jgi:hypothetical protein
VRIAGLDALEHVPLAVACCAAAIFLLAKGRTDPPPLDFVRARLNHLYLLTRLEHTPVDGTGQPDGTADGAAGKSAAHRDRTG